MSHSWSTFISFLVVGMLWGCTNPLMKRASSNDVLYKRKDTSIQEWINFILQLVKNWQFILAFLLNQSGSIVYVYLLGQTELSNAVPICNSLTFVFTAITSQLLGEELKRPFWTYFGVFLILIGVSICYNAKFNENTHMNTNVIEKEYIDCLY